MERYAADLKNQIKAAEKSLSEAYTTCEIQSKEIKKMQEDQNILLATRYDVPILRRAAVVHKISFPPLFLSISLALKEENARLNLAAQEADGACIAATNENMALRSKLGPLEAGTLYFSDSRENFEL